MGIAHGEIPGDPRETCRKEKYLNREEGARHAIQEVQQHARVSLHGPTDIADHNQPSAALGAAPCGEVDQFAAVAKIGRQDTTQIKSVTGPRLPASRTPRPEVPL